MLSWPQRFAASAVLVASGRDSGVVAWSGSVAVGDEMMERDTENGMLIGPDGCHYDTEQQAHHFGTLGMCGCGDPEAVYAFIREILCLADRRANHQDRSAPWIALSDEVSKLVANNPEIAAETLLHFLTNCDVLEHGGSVSGSWLTDAGERIVDLPPMVDSDD